jgi:fructokinase
MAFRVGIDLGGTKIEGIVLEGSREVARRRIATPRGDYRATLDAIAGIVHDLERVAGGACTVGVGIPGVLSPRTGLVKNANSVWLIGRPLRDDLERALGRPVRIANDANCFAVSEAADGAAAGADVVFGVIVGTGTGAGVVVRGEVLTGPNAIAGEWGHNPLPWPEADEWPGPLCYCGKRGCIETFLSGPGLTADYERRSGRREPAPDIVARAASGDADAADALDRYERRLARALAGIVNVLDPDVIVLGGGMSNIERLYANVPRLWGAHVFGATGSPDDPPGRDGAGAPRASAARAEPVCTRLVRAAHGDSGGVRGAAWLWPETR